MDGSEGTAPGHSLLEAIPIDRESEGVRPGSPPNPSSHIIDNLNAILTLCLTLETGLAQVRESQIYIAIRNCECS